MLVTCRRSLMNQILEKIWAIAPDCLIPLQSRQLILLPVRMFCVPVPCICCDLETLLSLDLERRRPYPVFLQHEVGPRRPMTEKAAPATAHGYEDSIQAAPGP